MRTFLGCAAVLALAIGGATADDKKDDKKDEIDAAKLVGKWGPTNYGLFYNMNEWYVP